MGKEKDLITTPKFRMDFPQLFKPVLQKGKEKPEYSVVMLFEDVNLKKVRALIDRTIEEKWPNPKKRPKVRSPLRKPDDERIESMPHYEGVIYARAKSLYKPTVIDASKEDITDESEIYSGAYGYARIGAFIWEFQGKYGVGLNLYAVQKAGDCEDDERFVQQTDHTEAFEEIEDDDEPKKGKKSRDDDDDEEPDDDNEDGDSDDDDDEKPKKSKKSVKKKSRY